MQSQWDKVIQYYNEVYQSTKSGHDENPQMYARHSEAMIELLPKLRLLPNVTNVVPSISLITLVLEVPSGKKDVRVWYDCNTFLYSIYLQSQEVGKYEEKKVESKNVVSTIETYLQKIQDEL